MSGSDLDPTRRFSGKVENYIRYRPGYPREIIEVVAGECGLIPDTTVADIGSGTGLLSQMFLDYGCRVFGVEPNREMREAGERLLVRFPRFKSIEGTAEATTLPDHSVDLISAGQAFHWFDREQTKAEFRRILKPGGWVVLMWNERRVDSTSFLKTYEEILQQYSIDYVAVDHRQMNDDVMDGFFGAGNWRLRLFDNEQKLDFDGVKGRLLSSSYVPAAGHPNYAPMIRTLETIFRQHADHGQVVMEYDTKMYYGRLPAT